MGNNNIGLQDHIHHHKMQIILLVKSLLVAAGERYFLRRFDTILDLSVGIDFENGRSNECLTNPSRVFSSISTLRWLILPSSEKKEKTLANQYRQSLQNMYPT